MFTNKPRKETNMNKKLAWAVLPLAALLAACLLSPRLWRSLFCRTIGRTLYSLQLYRPRCGRGASCPFPEGQKKSDDPI